VRGSSGAPAALGLAAKRGDEALAKAALKSSELTAANINSAIAAAKRAGKPAIVELLTARLASMPSAAASPTVTIDPAVLQSYAGSYRMEASGVTVTTAVSNGQLTLTVPGQPALTLVPRSQEAFGVAEVDGMTLTFAGRGGMIERLVVSQGGGSQTFERVAAAASAAASPAAPGGAAPGPAARPDAAALKPAPRTAARPWPGFRGENAAGNGDGQGAVVEWNVEKKQNIRWSTEIPGISNASPIVSGNSVFVVTAISSAGDKTFRTGLYGDVAPVKDVSEHTWKIYALDKTSGKILWERTAFAGVPKVKRHTKASQANATPATDGKRVVAIFGSIGLLAAWDMDGKPLWTTDVGILDSGWFFDPEYQWGHSASPLIYGNTVIVQADRQKESFLAAYSLDTGKQVWKTDRDEISTWGTPTLFSANGRDQIVTNGPKVRGYDAKTGKLLWTLGPNSEVTVGTPVVGDGLVYVTGGYPPARPIYAIKPTATGDVALSKEKPTSEALAWANDREGTYIPSPIYYGGLLYTLGNNGILTAYDGKTGERIYRSRVGGGGSYAASPIAADGRLYLANEDGEVYVVRAGRSYEELAKNELKEVVMGTPAISDGVLVIRTLGRVYGIGQ
jgi:outer membrane protein assembly factor BamB